MRKLICLCLVAVLTAGLVFAVSAQSDAESSITVSEDGSCRVSFTMTLTTDSALHLEFPIPAAAEKVTLNGNDINPTARQNAKFVDLSSITGSGAGTYRITVAYSLPSVLSTEEDKLILNLELLCPGFLHELSAFSFTVTLPKKPSHQPMFESGYYRESTMEHLQAKVDGSTIRGSYIGTVQDSETLTLTLEVDETMFPKPAITARVISLLDLVTIILVALAIVYFFVFMRPSLKRSPVRYTAPEGVTAGEVGRWLTGDSVDLSLLVISWAQMGYLRIQYESDQRILLNKRMKMGNERSVFENQVFKALFGLRTTLDATGSHYARLCRDVRLKTKRPRDVFHPRSGNPHLFRILCVLAAFMTGVMLADTFAPHSIALRVITGIVTGILAVIIQIGAGKLILRQRKRLRISLLGCGVWLTVSLLCGDWLIGIGMVLFQFLAGLALAYGGRRSEMGSYNMTQLLGLRLHTKTVPAQELTRLMKMNPGYFHNIAPYALAMNTDRAFAKRFGNQRIPECAYLTDGRSHQFSATEWIQLLRRTVNAMDARSQKMPTRQVPRQRQTKGASQ